MTRDLDRALFLAGESTLTAAEVALWATQLGYPLAANASPVESSEQLSVVRTIDAIAEHVPRWRGE